MDENIFQQTISNTKEESIAKAIQLLQGEYLENKPLRRPNISTVKTLLFFMLWIFIMVVFLFLCLHIGFICHISAYISHSIATIGCLLIVIVKAKTFVRNAILLYQKHAPEKMRRSCLFVPSCSEYMLLSIEKYGAVGGVCKGLNRLCRCHRPNGGEDYP